jgi:hypothetical protein
LGSRACRCTLKLGVIAGTAIPVPRICGPYQAGYRAAVTSTDPTWRVEAGETPIVLPHSASGDIDFSMCPFVVRKPASAQPYQCLRVTLMEVLNAAPSAAVLQDLAAVDKVPIAVGILTLWPLYMPVELPVRELRCELWWARLPFSSRVQ